MKSEAKQPLLLHPEQENGQKYAWQRMENEPARWFMLFRNYCQMGRTRTLQAVAEQEREAKRAKKGTQHESGQEGESLSSAPVKSVSISGALNRASKQWRWRSRAAEWDEFVRQEVRREMLSQLDHGAQYVLASQRLDMLDTLLRNLVRITLEDTWAGDPKLWLAMHRQALAACREIRRVLKEIDMQGEQSFSALQERMI